MTRLFTFQGAYSAKAKNPICTLLTFWYERNPPMAKLYYLEAAFGKSTPISIVHVGKEDKLRTIFCTSVELNKIRWIIT